MPLLRKPPGGRFALPVAMAAVKLGERVLLVGAGEPRMLAAVAARSGMTGHAAAAVTSDEEARRLSAAAGEAGLLLDVTVVGAWTGRAPDDIPFDVAVVEMTAATLATDTNGVLERLGWVYRSLRSGGRAIAIDRRPSGLTAWLGGGRTSAPVARGICAALESAGFRPVRVLADRGGWRFVEGLRGQ